MRILLIDPPFNRFTGLADMYFNLGLAYVGAALRAADHKVKIYQADAKKRTSNIKIHTLQEYDYLDKYKKGVNNPNHEAWTEARKILKDFKPEVVGISVYTAKFASALVVARLCKEYNKDCLVVFGGIHASLLPEQCLKTKAVDVVVRWEGEETVVDLAKAIENKKSLTKVQGISFKKGKRIIHNQNRELIKYLDLGPFPARDLFLFQEKFSAEDMGLLITARGCPYNCSFCSKMFGQTLRFRSIENVIKEIKEIKERYGTIQFKIKDDCFTVNRKRVIGFCEALEKEKLDISWECTTRMDLLDKELVNTITKSGCNEIHVGIESGSEKILEKINKRETLDDIKKGAEILNNSNVFWSAYFMFGLPWETEEDIEKTVALMKELKPNYSSISLYFAMPSTKIFEEASTLGILKNNLQISEFFEKNIMDYYFVDPKKRTLSLTPEKLNQIKEIVFKEFRKNNTRPKNLLKRAIHRRKIYMKNPLTIIVDLKRLVNYLGF